MSMLLMAQAMKAKVGNPLRKLVLIKLADNANDNGECWPSHKHIADHCEISTRSVMRHIKALESAGMLKITHRFNNDLQSSNIYVLTMNGGQRVTPNVTQSHTRGDTESPPPSDRESHRTYHSFESVKEPEEGSVVDRKFAGESVPFEQVVKLYNDVLKALPAVKLITEKRKSAMRARWNTSEKTKSMDWWREYFEACKAIPFLMGANDRGWKADFDFLMTESKFAKIVEGGYQGGAK